MPDIKEKPSMGKPKAKGAAMLAPKQAAGLLAEKYRRQLDQRTPGEENEREYAADQVEGEARRAAGGVTDTVEHGTAKGRREFAKKKVSAKRQVTPHPPATRLRQPLRPKNAPPQSRSGRPPTHPRSAHRTPVRPR